MSERSCTSGANPFACKCATHFVQQPQEGSLYTVMDVGFAAVARSAGSNAASDAPPIMVVATRITQLRRVNGWSFMESVLWTSDRCRTGNTRVLPRQATEVLPPRRR